MEASLWKSELETEFFKFLFWNFKETIINPEINISLTHQEVSRFFGEFA